MRNLILSTTLVLVASVLPSLPSIAATTDEHEPPSIIVSGEGHTTAKPDLATCYLGVTTEASTAKQALADNTKAMTELIKTISDHGIPDKDVQTGNFSI